MSFYKRLSPCPVCGLQNKRCWQKVGSGAVHCRQTPRGDWTFLGYDQLGFSTYISPTYITDSTIASDIENENYVEYVEPEDKNLRFLHLVNDHPITSVQRTKLHLRGLDDSQIDKISDRLFNVVNGTILGQYIEGVDKQTKWQGATGLYITTKDTSGRLRDGQISPSVITHSKYVWGKSSIVSKRLQSGALPYQYACYVKKPLALFICEGILKPLLCASLFPWYAWAGFAGGRSTLTEIQEIIEHAISLGIRYVVLMPDADSFNNPQVLRNYRKTYTQIRSVTPTLPVAIGDWGQWFDKTKKDCDETTWFKDITYHKAECLTSMQPSVIDIHAYLGVTGKKTIPSTRETHENTTNWLPKILESAEKFHHVALPVGFGKTHTIGGIQTSKHVFYLSQQPDYPATQTLEDWARFPVRHSGKKESDCKRYVVPTYNKVKIGKGNCQYAFEHRQVLQAQAEYSICKFCPVESQCKTSQGEGYGFLYELRQLATNEGNRIRSHANSLSVLPPDSILVIDEAKIAAPPTISTLIAYSELEHLEKLIPDSLHFYDFIYTLRKKAVNKQYGLNHEEVISIANRTLKINEASVTEILEKEDAYTFNTVLALSRKGKKVKLQKSFFSILWHALQGAGGVLTADTKGIQIVKKNEKINTLINSASKVIFLDGTISKDELCIYYGLDKNSINSYYHESYQNNLILTIVPDFAFEIKNKEEHTIEVVRLKTKLESLGYAIITWKQFCTKDDLTFLSTSRGSNAFQEKDKIAILGLPRVNYGAIAAEYQVLTKELENSHLTLSQYYNNLVVSETIQAIGRLRAERRRDTALECLIVAKDLSHKTFPDFNCQYKSIKEVYPPSSYVL